MRSSGGVTTVDRLSRRPISTSQPSFVCLECSRALGSATQSPATYCQSELVDVQAGSPYIGPSSRRVDEPVLLECLYCPACGTILTVPGRRPARVETTIDVASILARVP